MQYPENRRASQGPEIAEGSSTDYNLLASFPNMTLARDAIEALGRAGIEGQQITLRGPAADEAADQTDFEVPADNAKVDGALFNRWLRRVARAGLVGAVVGAILGIPVGIAGIELLTDDGLGLGVIAVTALIGAIFGGLIFALVTHIYQLPGQEQAWELTFRDTGDSRNVVGVHSRDESDIEAARKILERMNAREIEVVEPGQAAHQATQRLARS